MTPFFFTLLCLFVQCFAKECENGTYEDGCHTECIHCLNVTQCQLLNGTCSYGCKPGYRGPKCNKRCIIGKYGENCNMSCSAKCKRAVCYRNTGICIAGCKKGWTGEKMQ
uniref:Scavenger receptor class F member 2 n=1 Tax=Magallana gigas TaxID=29159 RepID=A0A8W8NU21_MAGGI